MAKRLIDSAELIAKLPIVEKDRQISLIGAVADVVTMISECQPVDAAEVVRCKNCKHWSARDGGYMDDEPHCGNSDGIDGYTQADDFCSYGKQEGE